MGETAWRTSALANLVAEPIRNGIYKKKEFHGRGQKIVNMGELFAHDFISSQDMKRVDLNPREIAKALVRDGDLLFARRSLILEGAGRCSLVVHPNEETTFESSLIRVRLNTATANPKFYYYFFRSPPGRNLMASIATRTAVSGITGGNLARLAVPVPPLPTQRKIAAILSAYEDLIENNTRRIAILEEMARLLYREWFVHFRFPGHESARMVDSPLGRIPGGWEVTRVGEILAGLESGGRPRGGIDPMEREVPSIGAENIVGLGRYDYAKEKFVSRTFFERMKRGKVASGDILLYKDGAHIGRKSMFRDDFPHKVCCVNEHVFILRSSDRCGQNYLYFWLDQPEITQGIRNLNANAAQPGLNQPSVRGLSILLPDQDTLAAFDSIIDPAIVLVFNLAKRNRILAGTRDLLLPRLISGELDVEDLDISVEDAAA